MNQNQYDVVTIEKSTMKKILWCLKTLRKMIGYTDNPKFRLVDDTINELGRQGVLRPKRQRIVNGR